MTHRRATRQHRRVWAGLQGMSVAHLLHIRKTGGTAVKHALQLGGSRTFLIELHGHEVALRDVPPGELVFFFLRDPLTRFASGFYSRRRQGRPRYNFPWTAGETVAFARFHTANDLAEALSPTHPDHIAAVNAMQAIRHVNSHYSDWLGDPDYLRSRAPDVLFIGFQEQLDTDFASLSRILRLPPQARLPTDDLLAHRNPSIDYSLSDVAATNLRSWYAADYGLLALCQELRAATP